MISSQRHRRATAKHIAEILVLVMLGMSVCCNNHKVTDPPKYEFSGLLSNATAEEKDYLSATLTSNPKGPIEWPPKALRRIIDISLDVTGSVYQRSIIYQDRHLNLAEYYSFILYDYLVRNEVLRPGDHLVVRLYGAKPGGRDILVDQFAEMDCPPDALDIEVTSYSRLNQIEIRGKQLTASDPKARDQIPKNVRQWFLDHVKAGSKETDQLMNSPLLDHIHKVVSVHSQNKGMEKVFIFVTDGLFSVGDLYFQPKINLKATRVIEKIKERCATLQLKPFKDFDPKVSVIILGLTANGVPEFQAAQEQLLRWFFDPQTVTLSSQ